jgi:hypothetical protein
MLEQAVQASEAMRRAAQLSHGALIPALSGCRTCGTVQMIAAPALGLCEDCGAELTLLSNSPEPMEHRKPLTRAA